MALSFGRKKGQSAGEANDSSNSVSGATSETSDAAQPNPVTGRTKGNATEEPIDESWFETFSEEGATQNAVAQNAVAQNAVAQSSAAANPDFSVPVTTPTPQFSAYNTQNENAPDDFGDFGANINLSSAQAAQAHSQAHSQTAFNNGVFVDPSSPVSSDSATPFDTNSATTATIPSKEGKGGGLKKILPVLAVLLILGGGGAFWMSQQGDEEMEELPSSTPITQPTGAIPTGAPPATGAPTGAAPTGSQPTGSRPIGAKPVTANPGAPGDTQTKMQLKKLWNEGLALRKQNKTAAAKAKWNEAVKLARSKPGHEKSAGMIQQAIDKLK